MLETVQSAYDILDQLHLSVQLLAVIGVILAVTLLLSARELATWFFKINSLKREVIALRESIAEMRALLAHGAPVVAQSATPVVADEAAATAAKPSRQFPISH